MWIRCAVGALTALLLIANAATAQTPPVGVTQESAAARLQQACDGGTASSCSDLGVLYEKGQGVAIDLARAATLFQRACEGGVANGCFNLGALLYANGRGAATDLARAATLYQRACDGGLAGGCSFLGGLYESGQGVATDFARAATLYQRACDGGAPNGCSNLGALYMFGHGVGQDLAQARALYQRACDQHDQSSCDRVVEGKNRKACFIQGHGERDITSADRDGYSHLAAMLKIDNFDVVNVTLAQDGKVPDDTTVLVVAAPKTDYLPREVDFIRAYLAKGGKLLLMLDPPDKLDSPPLTNLIALAKDWGIDVGNNFVLDASGIGQAFGTGPEMPIAMSYPSHAITEHFNVITGFRLARSVTPIDGGTNGHTAQKIAETSSKSWAEADIKGLLTTHQTTLDPTKGDKLGPITLVSAVSAPAIAAPAGVTPDAPKPETRVVVAGDSDFASNYLIAFQGNADFLLRCMNWLIQKR